MKMHSYSHGFSLRKSQQWECVRVVKYNSWQQSHWEEYFFFSLVASNCGKEQTHSSLISIGKVSSTLQVPMRVLWLVLHFLLSSSPPPPPPSSYWYYGQSLCKYLFHRQHKRSPSCFSSFKTRLYLFWPAAAFLEHLLPDKRRYLW